MENKLDKKFVKRWQKNHKSRLKKVASGDGLTPIKARMRLKSMESRSREENLKISQKDILYLIDKITKILKEENLKRNIFFSQDEAPQQQIHCNYRHIQNQAIFIRWFSPRKAKDEPSIMWGFRLNYIN
ncbi:hypothetical protein [Aquimarina longa]|uniref:hypothetical protein n=1 Tax=Aquimarina longa TaxID=1080221 RepID=UPI0007844DDC|nr:hypothetical protein [Aquimarina longa]